MKLIVPEGWKSFDENANLSMCFQKTYPDGTNVILEIRNNTKFELWSIAEHRVSGPNENMESKHQELSAAIDAALEEMKGWDEYLTKHS